MGCEPVSAVRQRDRDPAAAAGAPALEQRREDLGDGGQRAPGQVSDLHRRHRRGRVGEQARPALVVEVVARARIARPEARQGAEDDALGKVVGADPEPLDNPRPEALQHHIGSAAEFAAGLGVGLQVDLHRLLPCVQSGVPGGGELVQGVAARRFEPDDPGSETQQLAAGERPRQVARQIDDEKAP